MLHQLVEPLCFSGVTHEIIWVRLSISRLGNRNKPRL